MPGSRGRAMGGAGVAHTDDENSALWNPSNLTQGGIFDLGPHFSVQIQSTNDFLNESEDLGNFEDNYGDLEKITNDRFNSDDSYGTFLRAVKELRDVNRDGQGFLGEFTGGFNGRYRNWSITLNNFSSFSAQTNFDLNFTRLGGNTADSGTVREFIDGNQDNSINTTPPSSDEFSQTVGTIEQVLDNSLSERGLTTKNLGLPGTDSEDIANAIARRAESQSGRVDAGGDSVVTGALLEESAKTFIPNLVNLADSGSSSTDSFDTEDQSIVFRGISVSEAALGYAYPEPIFELGGPFYVGGNVKIMQGQVGYKNYNAYSSDDTADSAEEVINDNTEKTNTFGVDLGVVWDLRETSGLKFGLIAKNLNSPEFDYPKAADTAGLDAVTVDPQVRLGISGYPLDWIGDNYLGRDWWQIALDYDVTKNESLMKNYETQYLAMGNEFNLVNWPSFNLAFRLGLRSNLAESREGTLYTGGLGINILHLNIDLSGTMSNKTTKDEDGNEQPTLVGGGLTISGRF